jgi:hypothetical protein
MLTTDEAATPLRPWLETAFRSDLPEEVERLYKHREVMDNVFTEMMTEWPSNLREPLKHLHQLHQADTDLMYAVIGNLFLRHLERHP